MRGWKNHHKGNLAAVLRLLIVSPMFFISRRSLAWCHENADAQISVYLSTVKSSRPCRSVSWRVMATSRILVYFLLQFNIFNQPYLLQIQTALTSHYVYAYLKMMEIYHRWPNRKAWLFIMLLNHSNFWHLWSISDGSTVAAGYYSNSKPFSSVTSYRLPIYWEINMGSFLMLYVPVEDLINANIAHQL